MRNSFGLVGAIMMMMLIEMTMMAMMVTMLMVLMLKLMMMLAMGSARCQPYHWMRREEMMTPTEPRASASTCR